MEFHRSAQFKAVVITAKITGALSIVGSSLILRDVFRKENRKKRLKSTTNRIVSLMSICDIIFTSLQHFLGTWLVPKDTGAWLAAGNRATCTFQGFVGTLFVAAGTGLNATLAVTYLLVVRYHLKDDKLQTYSMSFVLLVVPVFVSLGLCIWPLVDQAFNWYGSWACYIAADPLRCDITGVPCIRGSQAGDIRLASMIWLLICCALIVISTAVLYWTVLEKERALDQYAVEARQRNRKQSKRVAMQVVLYAGSFFITWIIYWISVTRKQVTGEQTPYWILTITATLMPLQGFWNAVVYFRPQLANKKKTSNESLGSSLRQSSAVRRAIGIFRSGTSKASVTGTKETKPMNRRAGSISPLDSDTGNPEGFKGEQERKEEDAPVLNLIVLEQV